MKKSIILACACLIAALVSNLNAQSITLSPTDYGQTVSLMGGDMERSANAIRSSTNTSEMIEWAFNDIAFNICRVQFDKNQELTEGTTNFAFYDKQILTMQDVKSFNSGIKFWAVMRSDYDGYGDNNNMPDWIVDYDTKEVDTDAYAVFLADYLEYMIEQDVKIFFLSIAKEWTGYITASVEKAIIIKLITECSERGISMPKIVGPGTWSISGGNNFLDDVSSIGSNSYYTSYSTHDYQNEGATKSSVFAEKCEALGKRYWNDETSSAAGGATSGVEPDLSVQAEAYAKRCTYYANGLEGEIFFEIWSRGINKETRTIYSTWGGTGERMRSYYIMKKFANLVKWGTYITSTVSDLDGVSTMAFRSGNSVNLWIINTGSTTYNSKTINISGTSISSSVDKTYWTNSTDITGGTATPTSQTSKFWATIHAYSISCYTFEVDDTKSGSSPIGELAVESSLNIYPNPASESVAIEFDGLENVSLMLYDMQGRQVLSKANVETGSVIDTDNLAKTCYILKLNSDAGCISQKLLIE